MAPTRIAIVLVLCGVLTSGTCAFHTPLIPHSRAYRPQSERIARYDTSLHMGLRTFIKTKLGRGKDEDGAKSKSGTSAKSTIKKKQLPKAAKTPTAPTEKPKGIIIPTQPAKPKVIAEEVDATAAAKKSSRLPP